MAHVAVSLFDIHFIERDEQALAVAMQAVRMLKPDTLIIGGDLLTCGYFSSHPPSIRDSMPYSEWVDKELKPACGFLDECQSLTKGKLVVLAGNHEERIERWCAKHGDMGAVLFAAIDPGRAFAKGRKRGKFVYIPYGGTDLHSSYYKLAPDLVVVHGWSAAKAAARVHLEAVRTKSVLYGHVHRQQTETTRDPFSDQIIKAECPGCLCSLQPEYLRGKPSTWTHGLEVTYIGKRPHDWTTYSVSICKGRAILPDGREVVLK